MSRVIRLLKRWINMLLGKSNFHVEQGVGKCYSLKEIKGYYNDLTKKVSDSIELDENGIPVNITITGLKTHFPIAVFQYGLGLYDLYLLKKEDKYIEKFMNIADWSLEQQQKNGMWDCMGKLKDSCHKTQSAMCQSEGASVLLRAYCITNNIKYYDAAKKAIDFMLKDIKDGGTCLYDNKNVIFQEYVWRLMSQTTKRETDIRSDIYEELQKDFDEEISFDFVMEEDKCEQLRRLLEWYMEHNYSVYSPEELEAVKSQELYYEVYSDKKNKYKGMTAEVIANRILREEYHRSYHLADEVIFLLYKIRRGILRYRGIDYKKFFELKYSFNKLSEQIWNKSRQDNYNPSVLFETWYRVMKRWKQNVVGW